MERQTVQALKGLTHALNVTIVTKKRSKDWRDYADAKMSKIMHTELHLRHDEGLFNNKLTRRANLSVLGGAVMRSSPRSTIWS